MSEKSVRYDRQLRLWGEDGQSNFERAKVCLLNASALGVEALKNLVLPGIGSFSIVDGANVSAEDLGNNFFITDSQLNQPRAKVTTELLRELNSFVPGDFRAQDPEEVIEKDPEYFSQFTLVIATRIPEKPLLKLANFCWDKNITLVIARSYGFIGYLRIIVPEHTVVEPKLDQQMDDLRVHSPFPELLSYCESIPFEQLSYHEQRHVPYVVLLIILLKKWRSAHDGKAPSSAAEKRQFQEFIKQHAAQWEYEDNFKEAHKAIFSWQFQPYSIPSSVQAILADPSCELTANSSKFWVLTRALRDFVKNEGGGFLPLAGTIPDMTSDTKGFVALQKVFQDKATQDFTHLYHRVQSLLQSLGRPATSITEEEVKNFAKFSKYLQVLRYPSRSQEIAPGKPEMANYFEDPSKEVHFSLYIILRAIDQFYTQFNRHPGTGIGNSLSSLEKDSQTLRGLIDGLASHYGFNSASVKDEHIFEMVRFGGVEMHNISALMGGMTAQEVIKFSAQKYLPLFHTLIFNGMNCTSATFDFI